MFYEIKPYVNGLNETTARNTSASAIGGKRKTRRRKITRKTHKKRKKNKKIK